MSAETPRRSRSQTGSLPPSATMGQPAAVVSPQPVTDRSIIDSVAGFISEVVPTAYHSPADIKDQVQWLHFESMASYTAEAEGDCGSGVSAPPLVAVLGYGSGVQVWAVPATGDAVEVLSWRHGSVRVLRILSNPASNLHGDKPDMYADKRPLMVLCDTATPGPQYYSLSFISLKTGAQVKNIKFKNPVLDVLANKRSIVVSFAERIAIFDAYTLEDKLTVTTCFLSPGLNPNPIALGTRWLAYAEKKLIPARRSGGGNEGEGVQSYAATVLHAAKSLGKGLRELGETVASSLSGASSGNAQHITPGGPTDVLQPGVITILDLQSPEYGGNDRAFPVESVVAHFTAHSEAIVCLQFDPSGMLLLTADKRGHDFHMFRIQPHPGGPSLAAVHHLYTLHRGDTSARVQDICFSPDSRWVAVSTLRGTTHVFPVTPYGGPVGMRTHATPHVVNRMSRFHRSAGLPVEGRSNSPVTQIDFPIQAGIPYRNPRLPPYPHPTVVHPLAQLRQPILLPIGSAGLTQRSSAGRTRLGSSSSDSESVHVALRVSACFAPPRAWLETPGQSAGHKQRRPVESLFVVSCHGSLLQYDLEPMHSGNVAKERVCDDTPVELKVTARAQWTLQRHPSLGDLQAPLPEDSPLLCACTGLDDAQAGRGIKCGPGEGDERWLAQVEIITHAGPHRRLWMGPQFTFKTYGGSSGGSTFDDTHTYLRGNFSSPVSVLETEPTDTTITTRPARSKPLNMPVESRCSVPVLIESGSAGSLEQIPRLLDRGGVAVGGARGDSCGETQLREELADAMLESPGRVRDGGGRCVLVSVKHNANIVAKVVNPLGTVVTLPSEQEDNSSEEPPEDAIIHENCDEALFRPVVGLRPVICLQPQLTIEIDQTPNKLENIKNQRFQGLKFDEIVQNVEEVIVTDKVTTGRKNKKSKQKHEPKKMVLEKKPEELAVNEVSCIVEKINPSAIEKDTFQVDDTKEMWTSIEKGLSQEVVKLVEDEIPKNMWSSVENCGMNTTCPEVSCNSYDVSKIPTLSDADITSPKEVAFIKTDEDISTNNNSSETTESDDSTQNRVLMSVADEYGIKDVSSSAVPTVTSQAAQKNSKKKAKKKRK